eukprot:3712213-Rhodomonas_salina.1
MRRGGLTQLELQQRRHARGDSDDSGVGTATSATILLLLMARGVSIGNDGLRLTGWDDVCFSPSKVEELEDDDHDCTEHRPKA